MGRANLGALLGNIEAHASVTEAATPAEGQTEKPATSRRALRAEDELGAPAPALTLQPSSEPDEMAPYLQLVRKETRLREDQQNKLTFQARRLNRAKATGTVRITDNTLIRVAVDLLLARIDNARGDDEAAILESLNS